MLKRTLTLLSLSAALLLQSCKKDEPANPGNNNNNQATETDLTVNISHMMGSKELNFTDTYTAGGTDIQMTGFKYLLSNFSLKDDAGNWVAVDDSYFFVDQNDAGSKKLTLKKVKTGNYTQIKFLIGVDSTRNVSGAQTGALDPITGMFWTWNSGYIFIKVEGKHSVKTSPGTIFDFHIGGFTGQYNALRWATVDFKGNTLKLKDNTSKLNLQADIEEVFKNPVPIDVATYGSVTMPGPKSVEIANNYADMFSFVSIQ